MGKTKNSSPLIQNPKAFSKTIAKTKPKKEKEPD